METVAGRVGAAQFDASTFALDDKYRRTSGTVLLTGVHALVRVVFDQLRADRRAGLRTAAFVSGYPGSPLGGFDMALQRADPGDPALRVVSVPGVNEDLAATAVWGSQQDHLAPLDGCDGVIGFWYGKAPGVDRCGDVLRHANLHGSGANGGVVMAVGDDPAAKSSTLPGASEVALFDASIPVLVPGTVQEVLDLGRHAYELSRLTGLWAALKTVTAVADGFGMAVVDDDRLRIVRPDLVIDGQPWRHRQRPRFFIPDTIELDQEVQEKRVPAAVAYAAANGLNEIVGRGGELGLVAAGHTYQQLRQALRDLGARDDADLEQLGIRLLRVGMVFPLDPAIVRRFADGLTRIVVVEEKRAFLELLVKDALYGTSAAPPVFGKRGPSGTRLVPVDGELTSDRLRPVLAALLPGTPAAATVDARPEAAPAAPVRLLPEKPASATRAASFCSGCPHNRSTIEASGSPVGGGVGCHALVMWMDRGATSYTHMGGEGAQWIGRAPFTTTPHFVQNVGDGTFFHSASLSVRFAVAAKATMTFKLLYNGVVAMTGGQDPAGQLAVPDVCRLLLAEGAARVLVVADDRSAYRGVRLPRGVEVWPRDRLAEAERALAATPGVTVLVYDQACANELRRLRKRGRAPQRPMRVVINEAVCEGCGDCGVASSCLSVQPVDTELGRKTRIHQSSCNTDYSCLDGNCPSFVTVDVDPAARRAASQPALPDALPEPADVMTVDDGGFGICITGIGGTGVVTVNQVLATAAAFDGLTVAGLDQTGLSQKGGPVVSHLRLFRGEPSGSSAVGEAQADCFVALDLLVATEPRHLARLDPARTRTVASTSVVPTGSMVVDTDARFGDVGELVAALTAVTAPGRLAAIDAVQLAEAAFGDHMAANLVAVGAAYQLGALPIAATSIERAIEVNGVAVERSRGAFRLGRLAVADPAAVGALVGAPRRDALAARLAADHVATARQLVTEAGIDGDVAESVAARAADLIAYQDVALARRYVLHVGRVAAAEARVRPGSTEAVRAAAQHLYRLMAYKDEYEVARLHCSEPFHASLDAAFPDATRLRYRLQPPVLTSLGLRRKIAVPAAAARPVFGALHAARRLRGTRLDVFGYTGVRRLERALVEQYVADIDAVVAHLDDARFDAAVALLRAPELVRGYEEVKLASVERYEAERSTRRAELLDR